MSQPLNYFGGPPSLPERRVRAGRGLLGWILFIIVAVLLWAWLRGQAPSRPTIPLSAFYNAISHDQVTTLVIDGDDVSGKLRAPIFIGTSSVTQFHATLPAGTAGNWSFMQWILQSATSADVRAEPGGNFVANFVLPFIPWLLILGFVWFLVSRSTRRNNALSRQPVPVFIVDPGTK